ncbi:MAG: rhodanese-like domain-containing protein [Lachnospiraceae bacterium]|nr:rhodanese-like domain-containing protein [Candidatus Equihabitans merdae]
MKKTLIVTAVVMLSLLIPTGCAGGKDNRQGDLSSSVESVISETDDTKVEGNSMDSSMTDSDDADMEANATLGHKQISQEEAHDMMFDFQSNYIIVDVRTPEEYHECHICDAICIPNETITDQMPAELPDKDQIILIYCRSGNRSKQAAEKLAAMGYTNVYEFGGINTWEYETINTQEEQAYKNESVSSDMR